MLLRVVGDSTQGNVGSIVTTITLRYSGTTITKMHWYCPRGEALTIALECVTAAGAPMDLTGITAVMGWDSSPATGQSRYEVVGDATGLASFSFTPSETFAMAFWQTFDIWIETSLTERVEIIEPSFVNITNTVAPVTATYYYGVGAAALDATALALLPSLQSHTPIRNPIPLTPTAQKCYFVSPAAHANYVVYLSGIVVPMLADRTETVAGVSCRVKETLQLQTWATPLQFDARAS